ncbi:MAG: SIS domain-containing protein [Actinobacteria bacterium]|nr:SIS domain-containing protein [Actinomycetota bacterium]
MCGIIGIVSRPGTRVAPADAEITGLLEAAVLSAESGALEDAAAALSGVDALLKGDAGIEAMAGNLVLAVAITSALDRIDAVTAARETALDALHADQAAIDRESARLSAVMDPSWAIRRDRLRTASAVHELAGRHAPVPALRGYLSIQQALSAIDRMEVRGRDSAGLGILVWSDGIAELAGRERTEIDRRASDPLFVNGSVRHSGSTLVFVYKAAAEIGELGDNTRVLRGAITGDELLRRALALPGARTTVIGHTRWASVGIISEPNAHPVNGEELGGSATVSLAVLNGDIDNHADLKARHGLRIADPITTDAKVIPAIVDRGRDGGLDASFCSAVAQFEGSTAIAYCNADVPDAMWLSLAGSGQGLYVGLAEDRFVVASEPYGAVEETSTMLRMDGESLADPARPESRGQIVRLGASLAGTVAGIARTAHDGTALPVTDADLHVAEVTTRDIDRGDAPHFLLKEITEAPRSFAKTIRGRIDVRGGLSVPDLDPSVLPADIGARLASGAITRVRVIGQGTAAVAGTSIVPVLSSLVGSRLRIEASTATELSGFAMEADMSDLLVIAVSQSGTTTDTNRTVDLVASRGAAVLAIVNRRGSELASKAHGVYYTSDGRDVEMSVASTKAFYAQVAAGAVLACAIATAMGGTDPVAVDRVLASLTAMPDAMREVIASRPVIAGIASQHAPSRRYWAVVGNGPNTVAANEVRIKLSELCYKSISCDVTEDKKHIDLSCEPMVLVCAVGLADGTATDVAKEVAIFAAHKAVPIVFATEGEPRFDAAAAVIAVPRVEPTLGFVLSAMAGHLFGYEAALAIDALARPLRRLREVVEHAVGTGADGDTALARVEREISVVAPQFLSTLATGRYDGNLEASTAVRITALLRTLGSDDPIGEFQRQTGRVSSPSVLLDDLVSALTRGIDELTRPIDAIKHQAKTVTVGISRSEEGLLDRPLVRAVLEAGAARESLGYATLKVLAALDAAVESVAGFTRYRVEGDPASTTATISILERGGIARELTSRVDSNPVLVGTKRRVAAEQEVLVARGRKDGRTVVIVPEVKGAETVGLTLVHVAFRDRLPAATVRQVLQGYDRRWDRLVDWVTETEGSFREDRLAEVSVADLLILPVSESADLWRRRGL